MDLDDELEEEGGASDEEEGGGAGWIMTFADLMSLLLCFFVLLLSFSNMDVIRFKKMADDMKDAFGVQKILEADSIPKGESVIKAHFSPGKPEPTVLKEIYQEMSEALKEAVADQTVNIEKGEDEIIVYLNDQALFRSGSAELLDEAMPMLSDLAKSLDGVPGEIRIAGHTDNIPIRSKIFRSNWDLSAGRAISVAHILIASGVISEDQIVVRGHAHTDPIVPNDTPENMAKNRRVEIHVFPIEDRSDEVTGADIIREMNELEQQAEEELFDEFY